MTMVTTTANDPTAYADWHSPDAPKIKLTVDDFSLSAYDDRIHIQTDEDVALGDIELDGLTFTAESLPRLRALINNPLLDSLFVAAGQQA
jgi:hypothetical protein